jgi:glucose/mannose-6-phosphate isomerase
MLDDDNVIKQRDPRGALTFAAMQSQQARFAVHVEHPEHDGRQITKVVVGGMGGSALAALVAKTWLAAELTVPFEVVRSYDLPYYVDYNTLVIASSYSGNTEETLSMLKQARERGAQVATIAAGGKLKDIADENDIASVTLPSGVPQRMALMYGLRALVAILGHFGVTTFSRFDEISATADWLADETAQWTADVPTHKNYAKQLALLAVGKTPVFYAGTLMAPIAYKWKISWNENAKNVAFWNEYPEFNHNEFMGWASHPIDKPFAIFDLMSSFENPRITKRFEISDRLLSGKRPKAIPVEMKGTSVIAQMLYGCILADFASVYVAILNGVDPVTVGLIEKLKEELSK